jgi:hypothetical protein
MHTRSQRKEVGTNVCQKAVFWSRKKVLMFEFMQQGTTISHIYIIFLCYSRDSVHPVLIRLERGALSLVSRIEELFERKVAAPV